MFAPHAAFADCIMTHAGMAIRATSVRMRLGRPNLLAGLRLSWTSDFHACRRDRNPDGAAALDRAPQQARHSHLVDQRINLRERRRPVLRHDDILFCGTLNRSSGNSLVPGVAAERVVRRWRFAPSASIVRAVSALLNSAGLFSSSTLVACWRLRFMHGVIESLSVPAIFCPARSISAIALMGEPSSTRKLCRTSM